MKIKKKFFLLLSCVLLTLLLAGCGSSAANSNSVASYDMLSTSQLGDAQYTGYSVTATSTQLTSSAGPTNTGTGTSLQIDQKLIYKGDLNIQTDDYEQTVGFLIDSIQFYGGYIVSQEDYAGQSKHKSSVLSLRIPSSHFFTWLEGIETIPDLTISKHIYTEDVSEEFVDLKAREKAKQVVIDKYIEYMALAENADELIRFTNELAYRQEELESVQARLRYLEHQVNYSSLNVTVRQSSNNSFIAELNFGNKLKNSFESGIRGFVAIAGFMLTSIIVLLPLIVLSIIIWAIARAVIKSKRTRDKGNITSAIVATKEASPVESSENHTEAATNDELSVEDKHHEK